MTSPIAVFCECSLGLILLYVAFRSRTAYHAIEDPGKKLDANWLLYVWFLAGSLGLILTRLRLRPTSHALVSPKAPLANRNTNVVNRFVTWTA